MHAKATIVRFHPDTVEEAIHIFRDIMLPTASLQQGFKGAFIFKSDTDAEKHIIISMWDTKTDMETSRPPENILPLLEPLEQCIAELSQDTYEVLLQM